MQTMTHNYSYSRSHSVHRHCRSGHTAKWREKILMNSATRRRRKLSHRRGQTGGTNIWGRWGENRVDLPPRTTKKELCEVVSRRTRLHLSRRKFNKNNNVSWIATTTKTRLTTMTTSAPKKKTIAAGTRRISNWPGCQENGVLQEWPKGTLSNWRDDQLFDGINIQHFGEENE